LAALHLFRGLNLRPEDWPEHRDTGWGFGDVKAPATRIRAVREELWHDFIRRGVKLVGHGLSLGGDSHTLVVHSRERRIASGTGLSGMALHLPESRGTLELGRFSALANATPMVCENLAVRTDSAVVTAGAWAGAGRFMLSAYSPEESRLVDVRVDKKIIARYGMQELTPLDILVLDRDGHPIAGRSLQVNEDADSLRLIGPLGPDELLLAVKGCDLRAAR
jgi:hypothetical protein